MSATDPDRIAVGVVRSAWGIAGALRIEPFNEARESVLKSIRRWWLEPNPQFLPTPSSAQRSSLELRVKRCRVHGEWLVAQAESIDDRTQAEALKGMLVKVDRADFPRAGAGEFYWVDLIGCDVIGSKQASLGKVVALDDHGAHAILVVRDASQERLIPFVESYLESVDLEGRRIVVQWDPEW